MHEKERKAFSRSVFFLKSSNLFFHFLFLPRAESRASLASKNGRRKTALSFFDQDSAVSLTASRQPSHTCDTRRGPRNEGETWKQRKRPMER